MKTRTLLACSVACSADLMYLARQCVLVSNKESAKFSAGKESLASCNTIRR